MTPALFEPFRLRDLTLRNRIAVSPMQTYSAPDALAGPWHRAHLSRFAVGGAALVMVEATAVTPDGRSTALDLGLWNDGQEAAFAALVESVHDGGAAVGLHSACRAKGGHGPALGRVRARAARARADRARAGRTPGEHRRACADTAGRGG
ncbi:hypothetical protein [Amorphus sp. 3PC139-8]|uniref:oxidoreductase n=1 Tax=Amorphus sp. 3PC139-8 TaxID=2735676 RepID=UPI00345CFB5F